MKKNCAKQVMAEVSGLEGMAGHVASKMKIVAYVLVSSLLLAAPVEFGEAAHDTYAYDYYPGVGGDSSYAAVHDIHDPRGQPGYYGPAQHHSLYDGQGSYPQHARTPPPYPVPPYPQEYPTPFNVGHGASAVHSNAAYKNQRALVEQSAAKPAGASDRPALKGAGLLAVGIALAVLVFAVSGSERSNGASVGDIVKSKSNSLVQGENVFGSLFFLITSIVAPLLLVIGAVKLVLSLPAFVSWIWKNEEIGLVAMVFSAFYIILSFFNYKQQKQQKQQEQQADASKTRVQKDRSL